MRPLRSSFFFFNDTATTEIYTLSLHDALPIWPIPSRTSTGGLARSTLRSRKPPSAARPTPHCQRSKASTDRKSTRLNSSHQIISYAVFCLKKKKNKEQNNSLPLLLHHHTQITL